MNAVKKKNPVIEKAKKEGYEAGFKVGHEMGIQKAIDFFIDKFEGLEELEGIGPKTLEKIRKQLGDQYFAKGERREN